ncbi:elongation of very long chain fatty acids protein F-like [Anastrepha ludens]|uniref:elongation of very long chain fatty acids protein F-like n=1 Tax=Anastrepha ludens TaxID=28586 RepID=UPI0023AFE4C9|nr:elongation of very long chain fatty acids protein F-like [Anastrepha ludens]
MCSGFYCELSLVQQSRFYRSTTIKIMVDIIRNIYDFLTSPAKTYEGYKYLPFHGALWPMIAINVSFALFAFRIGPWLMRTRKPFNLKRVIMIYNIFQIIFNAAMVFMSSYLITWYLELPKGLGCIEQISYDHPVKSFEIFCGFLYLSNKVLDYLETIFFVLRKSYKQISILHVYHHIMMTSCIVLHIRQQGSGGHWVTIALLNTLVHTVMYVYYLLSSINPNMKKSLWWKKYITQMQLIQFILVFFHQLWPLLFVPDCKFPRIWLYIAVLQAITMIFMFSNFYIKTYLRKPKAEKVAEKKL